MYLNIAQLWLLPIKVFVFKTVAMYQITVIWRDINLFVRYHDLINRKKKQRFDNSLLQSRKGRDKFIEQCGKYSL